MKSLVITLITFFVVTNVSFADAWDGANNPQLFNSQLSYRLADLPMQGEAANIPWAGSYWPMYKDSVNHRWDGPNSDSPIEKYAKAFGLDPVLLENGVSKATGIDSRKGQNTICETNSDCNQSNGEICAKRRGKLVGLCIPTWYGLNHAWAAASVNEPEPKNSVTKNGITFKVNDIKALLSLIYNRTQSRFIGLRCSDKPEDIQYDNYGRPTDPECRDTNAGSFHTILTNLLGINNQAIIKDKTWTFEVSNQPIRGYEVLKMDEITMDEAAFLANMPPVGGTKREIIGRVGKKRWRRFGPFRVTPGGTFSAYMTGDGNADLHVFLAGRRMLGRRIPIGGKNLCAEAIRGGSNERCYIKNIPRRKKVYVMVYGNRKSNFNLTLHYNGQYNYYQNSNAVVFYRVKTKVYYITESHQSTDGDLDETLYTRNSTLEYVLELNANRDIIGGEWIDHKIHPDFLWLPTSTPYDVYVGGYVMKYSKIKDLLNLSQ